MQTHDLQHGDLARVVTHVHQGAIDVLGPVVKPATVHQSKFSMGTVLALVARYGHAGLTEFAQHFEDEVTRALRDRVEMKLDDEVDAAYPQRWIGKVTVHTADGRELHGRVDEPKGDPGNTLSREEITAKALRLAAFSGGATAAGNAGCGRCALGRGHLAARGGAAGACGMSAALASARSFLFVPANRPERFAKALASGADAVIIDLEDAVSPADKAAARRPADGRIHATHHGRPRAAIVVRMNAAGSPFHDDDLGLLQQLAGAGPGRRDGAQGRDRGRPAPRRCNVGPASALLPLIESVAGLDAAGVLAKAPQVLRLAFGNLDFQADLGLACAPDETELMPVRLALVLASRRALLPPPVDGVTPGKQDLVQLQRDAARAQRGGFGGKLCIHPAQVAGVNAAFSPSTTQLEWARRVLAAFDAAGGGVCSLDGRMVDAPVVRLARRTLAQGR